jgi:hypothetical protein
MKYTRPRLPTREMMYIVQSGREIHTCNDSRPGIPLKIKDWGATQELLATGTTNSGEELYFSRSLFSEETELRNRKLIQIFANENLNFLLITLISSINHLE